MNVYARTSLRAMAPAVRGLGELVTQRPVAAGGDRCPTHPAQPDEVDVHPGVHAEVAQAGTNRPREASTPRRGEKEHEPASAEKTSLSTNKTKRRARDSNPQPISRHLISSQLTPPRITTIPHRVYPRMFPRSVPTRLSPQCARHGPRSRRRCEPASSRW